MTNLQALLEAHQTTRLLRLSFPRNDGPPAKLVVNRFVGTEYLSRDFEFTVELLSDDARVELEAMEALKLTALDGRQVALLRPQEHPSVTAHFQLPHITRNTTYMK